jgi:hypothetical protein
MAASGGLPAHHRRAANDRTAVQRKESEEIMKLDADLEASLHRAKKALFEAHHQDPTFTGCGIGLRRRAGVSTDEPVVIAMVSKKLPESQLSMRRLLPRTIESDGRIHGVDVVEVKRPRAVPRASDGKRVAAASSASPNATASPNAIDWPIVGKQPAPIQGCEISRLNSPIAGALGCLVTDKTDSSVAVLSSNYVLAGLDAAAVGTVITQPSTRNHGTATDIVGKLRRYTPMLDFATVDAAIASLPAAMSYSRGVVNGLMPPISTTHPAVGMVTAWDDDFKNCFLTRMDHVVSSLNIALLPSDLGSPAAAVVPPQVGMHIEKVGPASGYTSSVIDALGVVVTVIYDFDDDNGGNDKEFILEDLIWTQAFHWPDDSGAIACVGGNGHEFTPPLVESDCPVLGSIGNFYNLPLAGDNALTSQGRDQFMAQSQVGNLLVGVIYNNTEVAVERLAGKVATPTEKGYASTYYQRYHDLCVAELGNPNSTTVITSDNMNDLYMILSGLGGLFQGTTAVFTTDETVASQWIFTNVLKQTVGMNQHQLINYMNDPAVYQKVYNELKGLSTIEMVGPVYGGSPTTWSPAAHVDKNTSISLVASAATADKTTRLFTVVPNSGVYVRAYSGGSWASTATKIDATASISAIASAVDPTGKLHLFTAVPNSGVWDHTYANGTWATSVRIDTTATVTSLAAAVDTSGKLHLFTGVTGSGVYERTYSASTWSAASRVDTTATVAALAATVDAAGKLHLFTRVATSGVYERINAGGTWATTTTHVDATSTITTIAAATSANGTIHLITNRPGIGVYDREARSGSWASAPVLLDTSMTIGAVALNAVPDETMHFFTMVSASGVWDRVYNTGVK